jgi:hypothetical protein
MGFILWIAAGLLIAGILVYLAALRTRRRLPKIDLPRGEKLPRTLLQRYASWTLFVVVLLTGVAGGMVVWYGPRVWWDNDPVRLAFTFVLIASVAGILLAYRRNA